MVLCIENGCRTAAKLFKKCEKFYYLVSWPNNYSTFNYIPFTKCCTYCVNLSTLLNRVLFSNKASSTYNQTEAGLFLYELFPCRDVA